jgi:hypothetical protein
VGAVIRAAFERGLWLLEQVSGASLPADEGHLRAIAALRDTLRFAGRALALDPVHASAVFERRMGDPSAPPALRGASLGALWSLAHFPDEESAAAMAIQVTRRSSRPATWGDFLAGLFALAREQVVRAPSLTSALDAVLRELSQEDFLLALPALRLAFGFFPPAEKADIARTLLSLHGKDPADARSLLRSTVDPAVVAEGAALDDAVQRVMERFGLAPGGGTHAA